MADFQQGIIATALIIIVSIWQIVAVGGPSGIVQRLGELGHLEKLNPLHFSGMFTGDFPLAWFITMIFVAILGGLGMGTAIDWYVESQRIQSARTVRDASYSIWTGTFVTMTRNALWALSIIGFFTLFPDIEDSSEYEMAWFVMGFRVLPPGMVGCFFAAILAIHFSTISTHLNLGSMYCTRDLFHHYIKPKATQKELVWVARISTICLLAGSFFYGLMMESITQWLIFALWVMAAGVWLPSILQVIWWRFNSWGYLASWLANLAFSWLIVWVLPAYGVIPELVEYQQFWALLVLGAMIYLPVTFLTKPDDMDHLVRYYVRTMPIGWWGPVHREAVRQGLIDQQGKLLGMQEAPAAS